MPTPLLSGRVTATLAVVTATAATTAVLAAPPLASPARADTSATGSGGQRLTVSDSTGISRSGATVTVTGTGYDTGKGIYVGFCVDNGAGVLPTPCGGGVDTSGGSGSSHWISSNPPSYGEGLAVPYGDGGSFQVRIPLTARIGDVDCTVRTCSVVTRADHTRTSDRSQDVRVPISFAAAAPARTGAAPAAGSPDQTTAPPAPATGDAAGPADTDGTAGDPSGSAPAASAGTGQPTDDTGGPTAVAGTAGTDPTGLAVTRVSTVGPAGRWWSSTLILLALGVLALAGLSAVRRRRRRSRS
ncbi:hypothetical protein O7621_10695 [Solwaraspora sp. WMMD937]|uniref:hypothetical protein n=1 Tax=Solwaraspora sp. WMMD937 TaxID=3016090 RepID=UPI00249A83B3|nr:hypothetical protein [Solwaraspora sp. WMMD937]WFE23693.1 hypothetical protein O7621_10695 [Solwaraspora sp. WMMD937]